MAQNFFFNNFQSSMEQNLLEDLIIEAIRQYGQDMYYLPRTVVNYDQIYGADDQSAYNNAYLLEIYIKNVNGFGGDGSFMSKFGIEIRDQVVFSMAQRRFNEEVGVNTTQVRPNEGDLIYFPLNNKCFQIKFVQKFEMFYQLGALQTWEVTCELFEYSGESMNTGIPQIDILQSLYDTNYLNYQLLNEDGSPLVDESGNAIIQEGHDATDLITGDDAAAIQNEGDQFIDFSTVDPFSEGSNL